MANKIFGTLTILHELGVVGLIEPGGHLRGVRGGRAELFTRIIHACQDCYKTRKQKQKPKNSCFTRRLFIQRITNVLVYIFL